MAEESSQPRKKTIVVLDDDEGTRVSVGQMLRLRGFKAEIFSSAEAALSWPDLAEVDCAIVDVKMPGMDGEEFLAEIIRRRYPPPIIMVTGHGDISMAVRCLKAGAYDFVEKPFEADVLMACVARAVEKTALRRESEELRRRLRMASTDEDGRFGMVGRCRVMQDIYEQIGVVAKSDAPVLIVGETGAGKELVARAVHNLSARAQGPFVPVNAGALSDTMLESELYGHARGAFTGADRDRDGKLVTASGGTLLMDEVENLSERAQLQLLRVLEDGLVYPVGKDEPRKVNVRLLATAKTDLKEHVRNGTTREDFYHRIVVLTICVPPLRERTEDIPLLISHFLKAAAAQSGIPVPNIPEESLAQMLRHDWPGNVRELKHAIQRMVITSHGGVAGPFAPDESFGPGRLLSLPATPGPLRDELERTERTVIERALRDNAGEVGTTAQALGISRRALYERMKKYGLQKQTFKSGL
jgi:two-component system C4-dicarboxylate transport response regulator DctD